MLITFPSNSFTQKRIEGFLVDTATPVKLSRLKNNILIIAMAATFASAVCYFMWQYLEIRREHKELLRTKEQLTRRYEEASEKLVESQRILERLRTDPVFVEMIIRRRLGYAKAGELIYYFETPTDTPPLPSLILSETTPPVPPPPAR